MYLVKNVKLFDPQPMGKVDILVTNDRVAAVGNDLHPQIPGLTVIDGTGKTAVPGFIDQHVHVTGGGGEGGFNSRTPELMLSTVIKAGVTTLVGLLGTDSYTKSVENVLAKTKEFNADGITAYCLTGAYVYPPVTVTGSVSKDIVYIKEILGCKLAISDHRCSRPTKEELIRLASDIRMAALVSGKPGILHIHLGGCGRQLEDIIEIVEEAYLPIKHFRPTQRLRSGLWNWADGQILLRSHPKQMSCTMSFRRQVSNISQSALIRMEAFRYGMKQGIR